MEETEEKNSYDTKYRLFLSEKDEYVPTTHVGMYSLFRNEANKTIYMSEERCQNIRCKTYQSTMELFRKYEAPTYCTFFNYNGEALVALGMNYFATHDKFAPIAELVEAFPEQVDTGNVPAIAISYGIEKITLKYYIDSLKSGTDFWSDPPVSVRKRKKTEAKKRDIVMFGEDEIKMDYWSSIHLPRNPLYHRFVDWCKIQNIQAYEGVLMALEHIMEDNPAAGLEDVAVYDKIGELDIPIYAKPRGLAKRAKREVILSGTVTSLADKIIDRYNRDPKNIARRIDFNIYCSNALHLLNQSMDLEYRDPDLYEEEMMMDEAENYNNKILSEKPKESKMSKRAKKQISKCGE